MRKGNGSNGIPAWVKLDLQVLKRVSVSLVEMMRESRQESREMKQEFRDIHRENQRRFTENEKILSRLDEQTADLKRLSNIHSKAILTLLKKV